MTLFVNCCPRKESRTKHLADALLDRLGEYEEIDLFRMNLQPLDAERLKKRERLLAEGRLDDDEFALARQFARADRIVAAAPFWDLSFPAELKIYLENIYIIGIVSSYDENGLPVGLCKAEKLYYVTTAGGPYDGRFGYDYLTTLFRDCFGIPSSELLKAEMLDVFGSDPDTILNRAIENIRNRNLPAEGRTKPSESMK